MSKSKSYALIAAGGMGTRMGASVPKQFLKVGGVPIIVRTVSNFIKSPEVAATVVCVPAEYTDETRSIFARCGIGSDVAVVPGGSDRHMTVAAGCAALRGRFGAADDSIVLTHDAVRPFINERIIRENIEAAREYGAAETVVASTDTVLLSADGRFAGDVPDRKTAFRVQTPQTFVLGELITLLDTLTPESASRYTDTAALFSENGSRVFLVRGEEYNIKITTPFDLAVAEAFIAQPV